MLNKWEGFGRVTSDVTLRYTTNQTAVCSFSVAVQDDYNKEQTDFIDITAWRSTAEFASKHLKKGMRVVVAGRLKTKKRKFEGLDKEITTMEVVAENLYPIWDKPKSEETQAEETGNFVDLTEANDGDIPF